MDKERNSNNSYVFGLDIGTRSVVGVVGYLEYGRFKIAAMAQQLHTTRAMLDGQIHDIYKVGDTIRQVKLSLERQLNMELKDVCIETKTQIICTTHSRDVFDSLPNEARIYIESVNGNTKITNSISSEFAFSKLSGGLNKELEIRSCLGE